MDLLCLLPQLSLTLSLDLPGAAAVRGMYTKIPGMNWSTPSQNWGPAVSSAQQASREFRFLKWKKKPKENHQKHKWRAVQWCPPSVIHIAFLGPPTTQTAAWTHRWNPGLAATGAELDVHFTFETSGKSPSHAALWFLSYKSGYASSAMTIHSVNSGARSALCHVFTQHSGIMRPSFRLSPGDIGIIPFFWVFLLLPAQGILGNDPILLSLLVLSLFWQRDVCCVRTGVGQVPETAANRCGFINLSASIGVQGTLPHLFMC